MVYYERSKNVKYEKENYFISDGSIHVNEFFSMSSNAHADGWGDIDLNKAVKTSVAHATEGAVVGAIGGVMAGGAGAGPGAAAGFATGWFGGYVASILDDLFK